MDRFAKATRIDVMYSPVMSPDSTAFGAQAAQLMPARRAVCTDPDTIKRIGARLKHWGWWWMPPWKESDKLPVASLIFHDEQQWLGTLDVYPAALGYGRNLVRRISKDDSAELLQITSAGAAVSPPPVVR